MKRQKTKKNFSISMNRKMYELIEDKFTNKSAYIEWLIQQDLLKNNVEEIKKIIL
jgi:hypothetical protein